MVLLKSVRVVLVSWVPVVALASLLSGPPARAETGTAAAPSSDSDALVEIVVTAQRRTEDLQKVPIAITVVTPQELKDFDIKTLDAVQLVTSGLTFDTGFSYAQSYIRGIGSENVNPGLESAVATYVDGMYIERAVNSVNDILDSSSVQVLKGPQGTLYGRNATGGAILITTADPTDKSEAWAAVEGGTEYHRLGELVVNTPISDTLSMRIAARENYEGDYVNNLYNGMGFGSRKSGEVRIKFRWAPFDNFTAVVGLDHIFTSSQSYFTQERAPVPYCAACAIPDSGATATPGFYNADNNVQYPNNQRVSSGYLRLNYNTGIYQFTNTSSVYHNVTYGGPIDLDQTSYDLFSYNEAQGGTSYADDFQVSTNSDGWINGIVGATYFHDKSYIGATLGGGAFAALESAIDELPTTLNDLTTESESVLAEAYLTPVDRLKITLGARYSRDKREIDADTNLAGQLANGVPPTTPLGFSNSATFSSTTPRVVVDYDFGLINTYASFNKGFKAGGFNTATFAQEPAIRPETIDSYELGAKFVSEDRRLQVSAAAFHYTYSDLQVTIVNLSSGGSEVQNAASALGSGGETDITFRATPWLQLLSGVSYLDAKFGNYPNASVAIATSTGLASGTENLSGSPLARSPRWSGYVGANVTANIGHDWIYKTSLVARHSTPYDFVPGRGGPLGYDYQPGYTLANLTAGVGPSDGKYMISLYVKNLTNSKYYIQRTTEQPFGIFDIVARPITGGIRLDYHF